MKSARSFAKAAAVASSVVLMAGFVYYHASGRVPLISRDLAAGPPATQQADAATQPVAAEPMMVMSGSKSFSGGTIVAGGQLQTVALPTPAVMSSSKSTIVFSPIAAEPTLVMTGSKSGPIFSPTPALQGGTVVTLPPGITLTPVVGGVGTGTLTLATTQPGFTGTVTSYTVGVFSAATSQPAALHTATLFLSPATTPTTQP